MANRDIPENIKRVVRQKCCFGCVLCGSPVFDYHHIIDYSIVKKHEESNIVLLCRKHHSDVTTGKISRELINEAKINPFNRARQFTTEYKLEVNRSIEVQVGSNTIDCQFPTGNGVCEGLWINGKTYLGINSENGWLTMSLILTDMRSNILLIVEKGEIIISTSIWDYSYIGSHLQIKSSDYIILDMTLSNYFVSIQKGIFIDKNNDGFCIDSGILQTICEGIPLAYSMGCKSLGCSTSMVTTGGWGILDKKAYGNEEKHNRFNFFRIIN